MSQYSLRLPDSLMEAAKHAAASDHCSLNQFFLTAIAEKVGHMRAVSPITERAGQADREQFAKVLAKIEANDGTPAEGDALD